MNNITAKEIAKIKPYLCKSAIKTIEALDGKASIKVRPLDYDILDRVGFEYINNINDYNFQKISAQIYNDLVQIPHSVYLERAELVHGCSNVVYNSVAIAEGMTASQFFTLRELEMVDFLFVRTFDICERATILGVQPPWDMSKLEIYDMVQTLPEYARLTKEAMQEAKDKGESY